MGTGLDLFARRSDGTEFPVEISLSPMPGNDVELTATSIHDVTDRRAIAMELKSAREAADRAKQTKSRFLAMASHDLRQPVQTLALLNGALCRMVTDSEPAEALAQQDQAIRAMSRLLNAILDISKLESGAINPELTDFTVIEIFAEVRSEFARLAAHKELQLEVEASGDCVHSDPSLIEQVLRNLMSNAIKYTQRGLVRLRCLHDQAFVRLEVLDTGIGMPANALAHIYDEFYQVGVSGSTARDGYGLGLSIVNRIVNLLGHRLEVRSELGKGSAFSLELPRGQTMQACTAAQCGQASAWVNAQCAAHGDIALLVTDYHLANQETGVQVIAAVRSQLAADLKAILITGDTSAAAHAIQHNDRVRMTSKPINADEFTSLLRELIEV